MQRSRKQNSFGKFVEGANTVQGWRTAGIAQVGNLNIESSIAADTTHNDESFDGSPSMRFRWDDYRVSLKMSFLQSRTKKIFSWKPSRVMAGRGEFQFGRMLQCRERNVSPWCNPFAWWFDWLVGVAAAEIVSVWSSSLYAFLFPPKFNFPLTAETQLVVANFLDFHNFIASRRNFLAYLFPFRSLARVSASEFFHSFIIAPKRKIYFPKIFFFSVLNSQIAHFNLFNSLGFFIISKDLWDFPFALHKWKFYIKVLNFSHFPRRAHETILNNSLGTIICNWNKNRENFPTRSLKCEETENEQE